MFNSKLPPASYALSVCTPWKLAYVALPWPAKPCQLTADSTSVHWLLLGVLTIQCAGVGVVVPNHLGDLGHLSELGHLAMVVP